MKDLQVLEHNNNNRGLTTEQLAEAYGREGRNISDNFRNNESRFQEGKHYFRLEGEELKAFKGYSENIGLPVNKLYPAIYFWTKQGAARHNKMLGTDRAWDVFDDLEESYFNPTKGLTPEELLLHAAQRLVEQSKAIKTTNASLDKVDERLLDVESRLETHDQQYYTITGYANLMGIRGVSSEIAARLGRKSSTMSRKQGYHIGREYDTKYGTVNTYHVDVLQEVFGRGF